MRKLFVVLFAAAFIMAVAMPAMSQPPPRYGLQGMEVTFRGEIGLDTKWTDQDANREKVDQGRYPGWNWDDTDITWDNNGSKLRVDFKKGPLSARFDIKGSDSDNLDKYYAVWDFGAGKFKLGKDDALLFNPRHLPPPRKSGVGDGVAPGADGMVLILPMGPVTISAAAYTPFTLKQLNSAKLPPRSIKNIDPTMVDANLTGMAIDYDHNLPRFEAKLDFMLGPVAFNIGGGWNSYSEVTTRNKEYDVDSHMFQLNARYFGGPLMIMADVWTDQNGYGLTGGHPDNAGPGFIPGPTQMTLPNYIAATDTIGDVDIDGWSFSIGYVLNDMVSIHVGYGEEELERENAPGVSDDEDELQGWEIAVPINITEFFSVTPYYVVQDFDDQIFGAVKDAGGVYTDQGKTKCYGAYWNIAW
jgi:hypothetical protein